MTDSPWMSPETAASYLSVSRSYIYGLISSREITSYKLKNAVRLHRDDLDNYIRRHARPSIVAPREVENEARLQQNDHRGQDEADGKLSRRNRGVCVS